MMAKRKRTKHLATGRIVRVIQTRVLVPSAMLFVMLIVLLLVFEGPLRRHFSRQPPEREWQSDWLTVALWPAARSNFFPEIRSQPISISFPFTKAPLGCEFVYGAAVYRYQEASTRLMEEPRYIIKFEYNLEEGRCESKDLFIVESEVPVQIDVQFIDVSLPAEEISEIPRPEGLRIGVGSLKDISFESISIPAAEPFRAPQFTRRAKLFSTDLHPDDHQLLISPYDDVKTVILEEIQGATQKCRRTAECPSIRGAVAEMLDPDIPDALEQARAAGMKVDVITNYRAQSETSKLITLDQGTLRSVTARFDGPSPWMWLRKNPHQLVLKLPMHTKFLIIGDEFVVSTNANFSFMFTASSREHTMIYRNAAVVRMFDDLLTQIRTSVYRPLQVDLTHNFILLFNADRPRAYSVTQRKPYVPIETNEGVRSSAYGILMELFSRAAGTIRFAMSPITNLCEEYRARRCLFDLLRQRAEAGEFELFMNGFFYFNDQVSQSEEWRYQRRSYEDSFRRSFRAIQRLFSPTQLQSLSVFMQKGNSYSLHHERVGVIGDEFSLLGSANLGQKGTVNVFEILRDPGVRAALVEEFRTFDEPFFVSRAHQWTPEEKRYGNCEITFERELLGYKEPKVKKYRSKDVEAEILRRHGRRAEAPLSLVEPARAPLLPDDGIRYLRDVGTTLTPLTETFESYSSYLCIQEANGGTYVAKVPAL